MRWFIFAFLAQCTIAFGDEVYIPLGGQVAEHQARGRARKVVGQETFVVTFSQRVYDARKDRAVRGGLGWDSRLGTVFPGQKNYLLTKLTLTLNGKPLTIPPEHLSGIFNPHFYQLAIMRDREKHNVSLGLNCGNTPDIHGIDFCFVNGQYVKRILSYTEWIEGRPTEQGTDELYHGK